MIPRVAFFTDSFHEVNGVALTSRQLQAFAARRGYPFFSFHFAPEAAVRQNEELTVCEMPRSRAAVGLERDLAFDPLFLRHRGVLRERLRAFAPDLVHVTGPGDACILGAWLAHELGVPLVMSWHTNVHEYAARRLLRHLPHAHALARWVEERSLDASCRFYRLGRVLLAPSPELCRMLEERTGRPVHRMPRGSDTVLFDPRKRTRARNDRRIVLGFVGRLSPEKNVRLLARIEDALAATLGREVSFLIVGGGSERGWLESHLRHARCAGVLTGEALAQAYADMDIFVFPSETDTYGNVVVEALASGVPAVVTCGGGPKYIVRHGETGLVASDEAEFIRHTRTLIENDELRATMGIAARRAAEAQSWDAVFDGVYAAYREALEAAVPQSFPSEVNRNRAAAGCP
jgi:glycosyltransferase involved in cell wall biosynthesis